MKRQNQQREMRRVGLQEARKKLVAWKKDADRLAASEADLQLEETQKEAAIVQMQAVREQMRLWWRFLALSPNPNPDLNPDLNPDPDPNPNPTLALTLTRFRITLPSPSPSEMLLGSTATEVRLYKLPTESAGATLKACSQGGLCVVAAGSGAGAASGCTAARHKRERQGPAMPRCHATLPRRMPPRRLPPRRAPLHATPRRHAPRRAWRCLAPRSAVPADAAPPSPCSQCKMEISSRGRSRPAAPAPKKRCATSTLFRLRGC